MSSKEYYANSDSDTSLMTDYYEVKEILARKMFKGCPYYLILWDDDSTTVEPYYNLTRCLLYVIMFEMRLGSKRCAICSRKLRNNLK